MKTQLYTSQYMHFIIYKFGKLSENQLEVLESQELSSSSDYSFNKSKPFCNKRKLKIMGKCNCLLYYQIKLSVFTFFFHFFSFAKHYYIHTNILIKYNALKFEYNKSKKKKGMIFETLIESQDM